MSEYPKLTRREQGFVTTIQKMEEKIALYENSIINCVAQFQREETVREFGSDAATISFFTNRYGKLIKVVQ